MNMEELKSFEPSWKQVPLPPTPLELSGPNVSGMNPVDFPSSTMTEVGGIDLPALGADSVEAFPMEGAGSPFRHPFQLVKATSDGAPGWKLSSWNSTITDSTNGSSLDIVGLGTFRTDEGDVFIEVLLGSSLEVAFATAHVEEGGYASEVVFSESDPNVQEYANLFVGRVYKEIVDGGPVFTFTQCIHTAQLLTHGLLNGAAVRVFCSHSVNPDNVDPPE